MKIKFRGKQWYIRPNSIAWYMVELYRQREVLYAVLGLLLIVFGGSMLGAFFADFI